MTDLNGDKFFGDTIYIKSQTTAMVAAPTFLALGRVKITVTAQCSGEPETAITETAYGRVLFFYVIID